MAYGLDVNEVYYTDHQRNDIGLLDKYEIAIDFADEKDFEINTYIHEVPIGGFWYIPDTEYGGLVYGKKTDSDTEEATYTGKTWRGILHDHILNIPNNRDYRTVQGEIDDIINDILEECDLDGLFTCVTPVIDTGVETEVDLVSFPRGTSAYEVIMMALDSINFTLFYSYEDGGVVLTPMLAEDYSDYMVYSSIGALSFEMSEDARAINHFIVTSISDTNRKRTIHVFRDENGEVVPYANVDEPVQDSDYILDTSGQVLFGVDEVAQYSDIDDSFIENFVPVTEPPKNWKRNFGMYYSRDVVDEEETYTPYEATESVSYSVLATRPSDWSRNYSKYFDRVVVGTEYDYQPVSANSTLDITNKKKVKGIPKDWKTDYGSYYYITQSGSSEVANSFQGVTKYKYVKMSFKPTDWETNWRDYYELASAYYDEWKNATGEAIVAEYLKTKSKYIQAQPKAEMTGTGQIIYVRPNFVPDRYYRRDQYTVAPQFKKNNTYMIPTAEVAPSFVANAYYKEVTTITPPKFIAGQVFRRTEDHYANMVNVALEYYTLNGKTKEQKVTMNEFNASIGDMVAGRDEYTGETIRTKVTNINATIKNGVLECEYVIGG